MDAVRDVGAIWNASTPSRLVCNEQGDYGLSGTANFPGSAAGQRLLQLRVNGVVVAESQMLTVTGGDTARMSVATEYPLNLNDYVELTQPLTVKRASRSPKRCAPRSSSVHPQRAGCSFP
mgnify:CR=1 FL=1